VRALQANCRKNRSALPHDLYFCWSYSPIALDIPDHLWKNEPFNSNHSRAGAFRPSLGGKVLSIPICLKDVYGYLFSDGGVPKPFHFCVLCAMCEVPSGDEFVEAFCLGHVVEEVLVGRILFLFGLISRWNEYPRFWWMGRKPNADIAVA